MRRFWPPGGRPAWAPDGRIVYTTDHGGLAMVHPGAGTVQSLTSPVDGILHLSPLVLPDGGTVLFTEISGSVSDARIVALALDTQRTTVLVGGGALTPQYADGTLFYARPDGALMAVPFDAQRVQLTGPARALPDRMDRSRFGVAQYAAVPGVLLYAPYAQNRLVELDRNGAATALTDAGRWHMPRYSPDGTRIAFDHVTGEGAERDVWTLRRADHALSRITHIGDAHDPTWLPDGVSISFLSFKSKDGPFMLAPADGGGVAHAVPIAAPVRPLTLVNPGAWLPDGSAFVAGAVERSGNSEIWRLARDGRSGQKLVGGPFDQHSPSVSADGRWLAYQSNETGRAEVYVRPLGGGEGRLQISTSGGIAPVWDKRSPTLYYLEAAGARIHLQAATLKAMPAPAIGARSVVLRDVRMEEADNHPNYDVDPLGSKFIVAQPLPAAGLAAIFDVATSLRSNDSRSR